MEFSRKKLPKEAGGDLRLCPIGSVQPFAAMPAPVYVYLRANEKFVAVKGPLDYFTPDELKKLQPMESFFFPGFVDQIRDFQEAGGRLRVLLSWKPEGEKGFEREMAPYELSDATVRILGPLWSRTGLESLFVCSFVLDLCGAMPGETLDATRDRDVEEYERQLILSSWVVFLALHLGYCDHEFLVRLRLAAFEGDLSAYPTELATLAHVVTELLEQCEYRALTAEMFELVKEPVGARLVSRLDRIQREFMREESPPSVYGEEGFAIG